MKHYRILSTIAGFSLLALATTMQAQQSAQTDIPRTISYQGLLSSSDGAALPDGTYDVTVTLYTDPAGIHPLWKTTYPTDVRNGLFNLYLGSGEASLPDPQSMNRPLWVGTSVNGASEMRPLTPLTASPYALNLPDNAVTTGKLADGAVTEEKVGMDYVKGFRVNGQEIAGKGTVLDIRGGDGITLNYDEASNVLNVSKEALTKTGDQEKGTNLLGTSIDAWAMEGDGVDNSGNPVASDANDWIGTIGNFNFTIKVYDVSRTSGGTGGVGRVMQYLPNGTSANILGGHYSNTIGSGVGNIIAGGGANGFSNSIGDNDFSVIGGGYFNTITNDYATISGGHSNSALGERSTIGGGQNNSASGYQSTVSGGSENQARDLNTTVSGGQTNYSNGEAATIGGGHHNQTIGDFATIGGGILNKAWDDGSTIAGGGNNKLQSPYSTVGGGEYNLIDATSDWGTISGGTQNSISTGAYASTISGGSSNTVNANYQYSVIAGGFSNTADEYNTTIGGGRENTVTGHTGTIAGGFHNTVDAQESFIGGGVGNIIDAPVLDPSIGQSVIGGGSSNHIHADAEYSTIGGGADNAIVAASGTTFGLATIAGGYQNQATGSAATIGGGRRNEALDANSTVAGGIDNSAQSPASTIAGGNNNSIDVSSDWGTISGGTDNFISTGGSGSVIGGGRQNVVNANDQYAVVAGGFSNSASNYNTTIGGGRNNTVAGHTGTIAGGFTNTVNAQESFIGGGTGNIIDAPTIDPHAGQSVIAGGSSNHINPNASYSAIGGGADNVIVAAPGSPVTSLATIPGGDNLIAQSWAQTVIGGWNLPKGAVPFRYQGMAPNDPLRRGPIFAIGNGFDEPNRSNAFEVSYNGHSTVFHQNGTGSAPLGSAIRGATYTDNVIYAWANAKPMGGHVDVSCDFGVQNIQYMGPGHYLVTMNLEKPQNDGTFAPMNLECGSVTATIVWEGPMCAFINTSMIRGNMFDIYISDMSCTHVDLPFTFKVTGRPMP